jgi:hypothetical protein
VAGCARSARSKPSALDIRLLRGERRSTMFSAIYDKADWGVGILLLAAIVCLAFA